MNRPRKDITDLHIVIHFQLLGYDVRTVQLLIDHTAADGIAVETYEHVEQRRPVQNDEFLVAVDRTQDLFRKIERVMTSLLI